jgi:hypothetical protein
MEIIADNQGTTMSTSPIKKKNTPWSTGDEHSFSPKEKWVSKNGFWSGTDVDDSDSHQPGLHI